jgi:hypothetical protein
MYEQFMTCFIGKVWTIYDMYEQFMTCFIGKVWTISDMYEQFMKGFIGKVWNSWHILLISVAEITLKYEPLTNYNELEKSQTWNPWPIVRSS